MLNFFRKYQRIFFIGTTFVIVITFTFFGTFSTFTNSEKAPDQIIGTLIDGSKLSKNERDAMSRFLASAVEDRALIFQGRMPNLLNDSVILKDFLQPGLATILVEKHLAEIKKDLTQKIEKASRYKPYTHPQASFVNAKAIWQRFIPELNAHLDALQHQPAEPSLASFVLLSDLYLDQAKFPADILKQFLSYQQGHGGAVRTDPVLKESDLSLFGFHTLEDWFGPRFLDLISECILNAAAFAEQKGYKVSLAEARADLLQNVHKNMQILAQKSDLTATESLSYFHQQVQMLGMNESLVLKLWQKVLLFRRLFEEAGQHVLVDPLVYQHFNEFAKETVAIDLYQMQDALRFNHFHHMLQFQFYLDQVSAQRNKTKEGVLALPEQFARIEEVEKKCPELVQQKYKLSVAEVDKEELASQISLKETWEWELDEQHFEQLKAAFPVLAKHPSKQKEERFAVLEGLSSQERISVDQLARKKMLEQEPKKIQAALEKAEARSITVGLRSKGGKVPLNGFSSSAQLYSLLQQQTSQTAWMQFAPDDRYVYRIKIEEKDPEKEILKFSQAHEEGILADLLDKRLEEAYLEIRKKEASFFQNSDGTWKPFHEVKDEVGRRFYADIIKAIDEGMTRFGIKKEENKGLTIYATHRFLSYLQSAKHALTTQSASPSFVLNEQSQSQENLPLSAQWLLIKSEQNIKRGNHLPLLKDEVFSLPIGSWSSVQESFFGNPLFFQVKERSFQKEVNAEEVQKAQEMLTIDAKRALMVDFIKRLEDKKISLLANEDNYGNL